MTPKEKAEELVKKYDETLTYLESKSKAKQCAIICIDEVLEMVYNSLIIKEYDYWKDVKQEIEKL